MGNAIGVGSAVFTCIATILSIVAFVVSRKDRSDEVQKQARSAALEELDAALDNQRAWIELQRQQLAQSEATIAEQHAHIKVITAEAAELKEHNAECNRRLARLEAWKRRMGGNGDDD